MKDTWRSIPWLKRSLETSFELHLHTSLQHWIGFQSSQRTGPLNRFSAQTHPSISFLTVQHEGKVALCGRQYQGATKENCKIWQGCFVYQPWSQEKITESSKVLTDTQSGKGAQMTGLRPRKLSFTAQANSDLSPNTETSTKHLSWHLWNAYCRTNQQLVPLLHLSICTWGS